MTNRRRLIIIIISVGVGSLLSLYMIRQRMGNLSPDSIKQLIFNFIFAIAIVVGIAILLSKNKPKE